jgi:hypothetical protein
MAQQNDNPGTSSVNTNSFIKGMNKDITQSMEPKESWWHARNAMNNSTDGDLGIIGNEPANLQCGVIPYTIIGAIHRYGDQWIVYSTDDTNSEIGRFDDSLCKYEVIVNDPCLNFNRKYLITGAAKENFDCTWQVYWDDGNNPSRTLNIDKVPWIKLQTSAPGDPCIVYGDLPNLDCEKIRLAPLVSTPCVNLTKSIDGGMLKNGAYQAFIAYTENEQKVTDYIGISNIQTLWSHSGTGGSLNVAVSNLDKDYDYYELVLLIRNQGQVYAKRIGLYSTQQQDINIDYIDDALVAVSLKLIPQRSPAYEKSNAMYVVNDWLIRQGPVSQFDFNYQPIANEIKVNWVANQIDSTYYHLGGNKLGFLRDEQYAFFIRWIYNTGERSSSYHIPGRAPRPFATPTGTFLETDIITGDNVLDSAGDPLYKVYNTGTITASNLTEVQSDGSLIIARGEMGYWESSERYPSNRPDIWGDLCGKPIRHHKFPTEELGGANSPLHISTTGGDLINLLGVEFTNIGRPTNNDGTYITNVVGYEILKGSRAGAKSILAKGLFRNMRKYTVPNAENLIGGSVQGLYPNHPYNDLRPDVYFHDGANGGAINRTEGCDNYGQSILTFRPLGYAPAVAGEPSGYSRKVFSFSSPDLMFTKPFLNAYETRLYGQLSGNSSGYFKASEDHPQFKLLRNGGAIIAAVIGIGYAMHKMLGTRTKTIEGVKGNWMSNDFALAKGTGTTTGLGLSAAANAAGAATAIGIQTGVQLALNAIVEEAAGLLDLYAGGVTTFALDISNGITVSLAGISPGVLGGTVTTSQANDSSESTLPKIIRLFMGFTMSRTNIAIGGNEILELLYNLVNKSDFVFKYNSYGFFNKYTKINTGLFRIKNTDSNYLGQSFQSFDAGRYKINNLFRPTTVAVALDQNITEPTVIDTSRFTIGGSVNSNNTVDVYSGNYLVNPNRKQIRPISAYYGALKFNFDNQYGQLDGIKQIQMRGCVEYLDPTKPNEFKYSTTSIFSGDTFITRYTEKVIMPIFAQYLLGQPDEFTYDYSQHVNIPYPRFWLNSQKFDMSVLAGEIASLGIFSSTSDLDAIFPSDLFYLDRGSNSCATGLDSIFGANGDPNPIFAMRYAYMYSHTNGILDFFVESEVNLANRDWEDRQDARIYDVYGYNDIDELFHAQIEKKDNFYKYDESLSPSKFVTQLGSFGEIQPRYYDPLVAENCYISYPKRLIYSLQAQMESKKDFWRVFLPFNYKDFKNRVSVIKPINKSGAIIFFPFLSPQMFQGVDTLKTSLDTKITIGDGGLFSQPLQNIVNSDLSNEYGSCESLRSVMNTPIGLFFISQAQGKIFHFNGQTLDPISNAGMKWWFNKYLPSQLVKQFPLLEESPLSDNAVVGVGCQTVYDPNDDIVYFMKRDYRVKARFILDVVYNESEGFLLSGNPITLGDPIFFDDCSWTISYDPKAKAWISFHDWHPEFALPSINHFFTTKTATTTIPQCPPGYTFNITNGLCERSINIDQPAIVTIDQIDSVVTGGPVTCLVDVVIAMDTSGSTNQDGGARRNAQLAWLNTFLNDPNIAGPMAAGRMQIGFNSWSSTFRNYDIPNPTGGPALSMSNTVTSAQATAWYNSNWLGTGTSVITGMTSGQNRLNQKAISQLGDRTSDPAFRQVLIVVTDTETDPGNIGCPFQGTGISPSATGPANQRVYALFCGSNSSIPTNPGVLGNISCTSGPINVDNYQFGMNAAIPATLSAAAIAIANIICAIPFVCDCAPEYTKVFFNPATSVYTAPTGVCNNITPPICRKITCECPTSPLGATTTTSGNCDDVYLIGDPTYVNPNPQICNFYRYDSTTANYRVGSFWRHNVRCDSFANYYGTSYPWEIELVSNTGQMVNTVRSMEYQLETYVYKGDMGYACNDDRWEDLNFNFDQSIIYNNEQVSGLLLLTPTPYNNPTLELSYPIINTNSMNILCSKVEHKYRFNQFYDITNDRGEFTNSEQAIWDTQPNGYIKLFNTTNLNYNKAPLQHKKFRHYYNNVILRRVNSGNRKMLLRLNNTKLLLSMR